MTGRQQSLAEEARRQVARRSPTWSRFFAGVFGRELRRSFHAVRISRAGLPPARAMPRLVLYANHPSWWDAAVFGGLAARLFPGRPAFAPIDAAMGEKYGFMARIGAFGVARGSARGAAQFLATAAAILAPREGLMFVTAQGRFADPRERPVRLAPGLAHLVDHVPEATFVPLAVEYPFWEERQPELLMRFGPPIAAHDLLPLGRADRQALLASRLQDTMDALAAEAIARDPAAFERLVEGAAGVGGVYDLWRRARAALRGERFEARHGGGPP